MVCAALPQAAAQAGVDGGKAAIAIERPPAGTVIVEAPPPGGAVTVSRAADAPGAAVDISPRIERRSYRSGARVTSGFGLRVHPVHGTRRVHAGVDLAAGTGAPVIVSSPGVVVQAGWLGGYGLCVTIDHGGATQTRYGHLSRLGVGVGQRVRAGQVIGLVGSTGVSTGPHLHYEVRVQGTPVNPLPRGHR
ncbi:MAG TPA: M23 family metallopeptidase [Novosphingobium sp.]|nr:M23 family metallopeptidase [Novosphingobium sp.]